MAVMSKTEPAAWMESVRRIPSNGATNTWLMLRIADTRALAFSRIEEEQEDARPDDDLDEPEDEDHDAAAHLGATGTCPRDATAVRLHRFLTRGGGFLGDDGPVDLVDGHGALPRARHPGKRGLATTAGRHSGQCCTCSKRRGRRDVMTVRHS